MTSPIQRLVSAGLAACLLGEIVAGCAAPAATSVGGRPAASAAAASRPGMDGAIAQLQARLRVDQNDVQASDELAAAYLQKARDRGDPAFYPKAETLLEGVLRHSPNDGEALILMGLLCLGRHQFEAALEWGEKARAARPYSSQPLGVIADAQIELGRYPEAVATIQKMVDLRPDLSSYARVSYARELYGDVPGAIEAMRMAIEAGGPVPENVAYPQVILGNLYFESGQLDQAQTEYQRALALYPDYVHALAGLGRVAAARGNYPEAIRRYRQAVEVYPAPEYVVALGDLYAVSGDAARAKQSYDLAAAEQKLYADNGINVDAELALFLADHQRDLPSALAAAQRAIRDRPSVVTADVLAWTLYQAGQLDAALAAAEQAQRLGTQNALFFFHSGMIKYRLGRRDEAKADLARALAINPSFSLLHAAEARQTLQALGAPVQP